MELSQELISIAVLLAVCLLLAILCVCIYFCRCRQDQIRASEEKHDRAVQLFNFEQEKANKLAVPPAGRPQDIKDIEKSSENIRSHHKEESVHSRETIGQYEERINGPGRGQRGGVAAGLAHRFRDEENAKNKRLDTISEIGLSNDSLQRNDSKTNVFCSNTDSIKGVSPMEVDLNPGLSSSINLEKI